MRWFVLWISMLIIGCPTTGDDDSAGSCGSPPFVLEAPDHPLQGSTIRLQIQVGSEVWSPHMLYVEAYDATMDVAAPLAEPGYDTRPTPDGWTDFVISVTDYQNGIDRDLQITITDPDGCTGTGTVNLIAPESA